MTVFRNHSLKKSSKTALSKPIAIAILLVCMPLAWAESEQEYQTQVDNIGKQIKKVSRQLNANRRLLKGEQQKLQESEQKIAALDASLEKSNLALKEKENTLATNAEQIKALEKQHADNQNQLTVMLRQAYRNGEDDLLKMLLNQENPYAVGRLQNYYRYFTKAYQQELVTIRRQAAQMASLQQQHEEAYAAVQKQQQALKNQQKALQKARQERRRLVTTLSDKVDASSKKLKQLEANKKRLNALIKEIAKQAEALRRLENQRIEEEKRRLQEQSSTPKKTVSRQQAKPVKGGFNKQKGRLTLPTSGKIKYRYGARLPQTGMVSDGLFIETKTNQQVHTIFRGRVVFADWLKGYGLLLIIDHGDQHLSLYGHNKLLYKKVGDMVETNEVVALTGVTGGLKEPGLYFEIRNNANPVNPKKWLKN